jgi:hypothetical protein
MHVPIPAWWKQRMLRSEEFGEEGKDVSLGCFVDHAHPFHQPGFVYGSELLEWAAAAR